MPKLCEFENCRKKANYGYFFQKVERCKEHKGDRKQRYKICRCGKHDPKFGLPNDNRPSYCSKCKTDKMICPRTRKCLENECNINPSYNFQGKTIRLYCKKHAKPNMININKNHCLEDNCNKKPYFNFENEKKRIIL